MISIVLSVGIQAVCLWAYKTIQLRDYGSWENVKNIDGENQQTWIGEGSYINLSNPHLNFDQAIHT